MNINGQVRQARSALVDQLEQPVVLEPLSKFPLIRDLMVDRTIMFACPKEIPLTTGIAELNKEVNKYALVRWLNK